MRRINSIFAIFFLFIGIFILFYSNINKDDNKELKVYSLKAFNEYTYSESNMYDITYYSNIYIDNPEYYLINHDNRILLYDVKHSIEKTIYNNEKIYIITISFKLDTSIDMSDVKLIINNNIYNIELDIGTFRVIDKDINILDYNSLEGHYSYINNNLILVGISISLSKDTYIKNININNNAFIQIQNIFKLKEDMLNIIPNYTNNIFDSSKGDITLKANTKYFLPVGYNSNILLGRINLIINDNNYIYLPNLHLTHPNINDYISFKRSGKVVKNN